MSFLSQTDPEIGKALDMEKKRQQETINLVASENYASKAVLEAQKKPFTVWNAQELEFDLSQMKRTNLHKLYTPAHREGSCEIVEAQSLEEAGAELAVKLREAGIV